MIYDYIYTDGDNEEFQSTEMRLTSHNDRPCRRVWTTGVAFKGVGWPGKEIKGEYTRVGFTKEGVKNLPV